MKKFIFSKFGGLRTYSRQLYYQMDSFTGIFRQHLKPPPPPSPPHKMFHQIYSKTGKTQKAKFQVSINLPGKKIGNPIEPKFQKIPMTGIKRNQSIFGI